MTRTELLKGKAYALRKPSKPEDYLIAALRSEAYIARYAHETEDGIYWKKPGESWRGDIQDIDLTFYSGSAGVLYFYLKLYEVTGEEKYLHLVKEGSRYLKNHWRDFFSQTPIFPLAGSEVGIYFGASGLGMILGEVYRSIGDETAKAGALEIQRYFVETAKRDENGGVYWSGSTAIAMDGGVILVLMRLWELFGDAEVKQLILDSGKRYVTQGSRGEDGGLEYNGVKGIADPISWPNYEFGTTGSGYLLTKLYEMTGEEIYLDAAKDCTVYMKHIQVAQEKGYLVPHDVYAPEGAEPVFFIGSCHGPGGNSKVYYQLNQLTGDKEYLDEINAMLDGLESVGAPERQSVGLWNTQCFCCGHAGMIQYFIGLYLAYGEQRYLDLARRTAAVILGEKLDHEDGTSRWNMAFWRLKPDFLTVDLGYYDGQAGIAASLLQMYLLETGTYQWKRLPEDPFPEQKK